MNYNFGYSPQGTIPIHFTSPPSTLDEGNGIIEIRIVGTGNYWSISQKIDFRTSDLATYQGGSVCGADPGSDCGAFFDSSGSISDLHGVWGVSDIESGTLSLANPVLPPTTAATPEPSSLLMLGTGLCGGVGVLRRRAGAVA